MSDEDESGDRDRLGIQSVEVAATILAALTEASQPLALKDLARRSGMQAAKVHRYLVSLTRTGLVRQEQGSGHYGVGPAAIALGLAGLRSTDAVRYASEALPALRDEAGETAVLAIWTRAGPVIIRLEENSPAVFMNIRVGSILPVEGSAVGRIFAAYLPERETAEVASAGLSMGLPREEIAPLLDGIRATGLASITGHLVPGVTAIAAPVFDHRGTIVAAVGLLGRTEKFDGDTTGRQASVLSRCAALVSRQLGYRA